MPLTDGPGVATAAPGLFLFTSSLWQLNSPVLARRGEALVIDPGYFPREIAGLRDFVAEQRLAPTVLFTHGDFDHVVGWDAFPAAPRWGSQAMLQRDQARVERQIRDWDLQFYVARERPFAFPRLDRRLAAAPASSANDTTPEQARLADLEVLFYGAPGHTADGLLTVVPDLGLIFCGDYLSDLEFPFVEHSLAGYQATLARVRHLTERFGLRTLVPGHGRVALTAEEILARVAQDEAYLDDLATAVAAARREGLGLEEAVQRLESLSYRGKPVAAHLLSAHQDNVRVTWNEAGLAKPGV